MKIVVAITGASGAIYAVRLISFLKETTHEISLVASKNGLEITRDECGIDLRKVGYPFYTNDDFTAPFASGSARYDAFVAVPCSMGTLGRIAHGWSDSLITRTADVFLKEKRKAILVPRETPFSLIHIENMRLLILAGATIIPASPSFYQRPETKEEIVDTVVSRILDHLAVENNAPRYGNFSKD